MKKLNLKSVVKVRLTPLGGEIFKNHYEDVLKRLKEKGLNDLYDMFPNSYPEFEENGYTKMYLWFFMELYGKHIGIDKPEVIADMSLYIDDGDLE